jgi:hypothetical protein
LVPFSLNQDIVACSEVAKVWIKVCNMESLSASVGLHILTLYVATTECPPGKRDEGVAWN